MEVNKIEVGGTYPGNLPKEREGLWPRLVREGLHVLVLLDTREGDVETFRRQSLQIGTMTKKSIPFLSLHVKRWGTLDGHINVLQYASESIDDYIADFGNRFQIIVVEKGTQEIKLIRQIGVKMEIANSVLNGLHECRNTYDDVNEVERQAMAVYEEYSKPADLASDCSEKQVFS